MHNRISLEAHRWRLVICIHLQYHKEYATKIVTYIHYLLFVTLFFALRRQPKKKHRVWNSPRFATICQSKHRKLDEQKLISVKYEPYMFHLHLVIFAYVCTIWHQKNTTVLVPPAPRGFTLNHSLRCRAKATERLKTRKLLLSMGFHRTSEIFAWRFSASGKWAIC